MWIEQCGKQILLKDLAKFSAPYSARTGVGIYGHLTTCELKLPESLA